jgi:hypothetical protein
VQKHWPTVVSLGTTAEAMMEEWLKQPIFMVDIGWADWRRYLAKSHHHILEKAVQRFLASIESYKDWMQLGWIEVYDDVKVGGQGMRAVRDIHLPSGRDPRDIAASISVVATDLHCAGPEFVRNKDQAADVDPMYLIQLDRQRVFDAKEHWVGKTNHLPMPHCNLKLRPNGKLVQIKEIAAGDALTWDYGAEFWVYQITGLELSQWLSEGLAECQNARRNLFARMHEEVLDYSELLKQSWARSLSSSSSAVARESVLIDLEDCLDAMNEQRV